MEMVKVFQREEFTEKGIAVKLWKLQASWSALPVPARYPFLPSRFEAIFSQLLSDFSFPDGAIFDTKEEVISSCASTREGIQRDL